MLVLTRKVGEQIVVSGDIRITIVAIRGDRVRLGIAAPVRNGMPPNRRPSEK
jgi:carbon storage regulator